MATSTPSTLTRHLPPALTTKPWHLTSRHEISAKAGGGQAIALDQPANKGEMMVRRLAARIPLVIFTLNLNDGKITPLLHSTDWIGHMLFSPTDPKLLMYCHEGPWQSVDQIQTNIQSDGTNNQLMHQRHIHAVIAAGNEFWGWDWRTAYYDLQSEFPRPENFFPVSPGPGSNWRAHLVSPGPQ